MFADYGPTWESLRRVAHAAVRRYAGDEKLAFLVNDVVKKTVETIKNKEGINKPFDPTDYIYLTIFSVLASSAFGKRLKNHIFIVLKSFFSDMTLMIRSFKDLNLFLKNNGILMVLLLHQS